MLQPSSTLQSTGIFQTIVMQKWRHQQTKTNDLEGSSKMLHQEVSRADVTMGHLDEQIIDKCWIITSFREIKLLYSEINQSWNIFKMLNSKINLSPRKFPKDKKQAIEKDLI